MNNTEAYIPEPQIKARLDNLFKIFSLIGSDCYIFVCDIKNDISRWSRGSIDLFGLPSEYMQGAGQIWEEHIHPKDRKSYHKNIEEVFAGKAAGHDMQYRAKTRDGSYVVCSCSGTVFHGEKNDEFFFGGAIRCLGLRQFMDVLTGCRNQYGFFFDLKNKINANHECCIMQIGIRDFSNVNNSYGYYFGNRVIQDLGGRIRRLISPLLCDVYHLDGSQFIIVNNSKDVERLKDMYAKLCAQYRSFITVDDQEIMLSLGAGMLVLNTFKTDVRTMNACLNYAFEASKKSHQGGLVIFDDVEDEKKRNRLEALSVIRSCIGRDYNGFEINYQPVVATKTGRITAVEALIRWSSPEYGRIPPDEFIPVLENDVLFPQLGNWILRHSLIDMKPLLKVLPNFLIHVNASYSQFESDSFVDEVARILNETGIPAKNLCIELTERCRLLDIEMLRQKLKAFKQMGIKIALDDFGSGYSSIACVRDLPLDILKVDREFVQDIETNPHSRGIIEVISHFASVSKLDVCVEGVENQNIVEILKDYSVDTLQGYYFSRPLPLAEFMVKAHELLP